MKAGRPETTTIRQKATINASPEEVYNAYVDARLHAAFTGSKATSSPKVNGKMTAWDGYIMGRYTKLVKGRRIVQEWTTTEWPEGYPPSVLDITLAKKGNATLLQMVHTKVPKSQAKDYAEGWRDYYWKPMAEYFEGKK